MPDISAVRSSDEPTLPHGTNGADGAKPLTPDEVKAMTRPMLDASVELTTLENTDSGNAESFAAAYGDAFLELAFTYDVDHTLSTNEGYRLGCGVRSGDRHSHRMDAVGDMGARSIGH